MPHDRKGQLVEVGDIIKGNGYNIKHEVIGEAIAVKSSVSCNMEIAVVHVKPNYGGLTDYVVRAQMDGPFDKVIVPGIEYGMCKDFEIVQKVAYKAD